jgi:hypothetical protein
MSYRILEHVADGDFEVVAEIMTKAAIMGSALPKSTFMTQVSQTDSRQAFEASSHVERALPLLCADQKMNVVRHDYAAPKRGAGLVGCWPQCFVSLTAIALCRQELQTVGSAHGEQERLTSKVGITLQPNLPPRPPSILRAAGTGPAATTNLNAKAV